MLVERVKFLIMMAPLVVSSVIDASANRTVEKSSIPEAIETRKVLIENPRIVDENGTTVEIESYINIEGLLTEEEFEQMQKTTTEKNNEKPTSARNENGTHVSVMPYNIVDGPCAAGMKIDANGKCRQALWEEKIPEVVSVSDRSDTHGTQS